MSEDVFMDGNADILFCTAALGCWGVDLPAHAGIFRGAQVYDPI